VNVAPIAPIADTLIAEAYETPDYIDAFRVTSNHGSRVEDFATGFFLSQPRWLAKISMNLGDDRSRRQAIDRGDYAVGTFVGSWMVQGRNADEIMFGEQMGFMEYRFSFLQQPGGSVIASTSVKYLERFGHVYFGLVKPFHRGFIRVALRNAAVSASVTVA